MNLLTTADVAKLLKVSTRTVRRLKDRAKLPPPIRVGAGVRWDADALRRWIERGGK